MRTTFLVSMLVRMSFWPPVALGVSSASAQWIVTNLNPATATMGSGAYAVAAGKQVGVVVEDTVAHAAIWSGSAASWVSLNPMGMGVAGASAISGGQQAGYVGVGNTSHACFWTGTAASLVDLHPPNADYSEVRAIDQASGKQAGFVKQPGSTAFLASLWSGTPASWVNLNPAGARESEIWSIRGIRQVGYAEFAGNFHAGLWTGTAASWVDLNPMGAVNSQAVAMSGDQQAGSAFYLADLTNHASLWSGTAASWVDLHPAGADDSFATAISGGWQAGFAYVGGVQRSLWNGTAGSWVDLSAFLPAEFTSSYAKGIFSDASHVYVTGTGNNSLTGRTEALLWTGPNPCPPDFNGGGVSVSDIFDLLNAWFALDPRADFNGVGGISTQDIFDFLNAWFAGCP